MTKRPGLLDDRGDPVSVDVLRHWARRGLLLSVVVLAVVAGCSKKNGTPSSPSDSSTTPGRTTLTFTASPVALDAIRFIVPLGNLNPPAHTLPTDHIYFYVADPNTGESPVARRTDFFAPADGTVLDVIDNGIGGDRKVRFQAASAIVYYVDHLIPAVTLTRGTAVTAGMRLGTSGSSYGIDLGVVNEAVTLSFISPARYGSETLHADAPLKYFQEPLRAQLYGKVQSIAPNADGKIDFDVPGRLSGNWFGESDQVPLAFAYDTYDPGQVRISVGGGLSQQGVFAIGSGDPAPRDISPASGVVALTIGRVGSGPQSTFSPVGRLLAQMLDERRIRVEIVDLAAGSAFSGAAKVFVR